MSQLLHTLRFATEPFDPGWAMVCIAVMATAALIYCNHASYTDH